MEMEMEKVFIKGDVKLLFLELIKGRYAATNFEDL